MTVAVPRYTAYTQQLCPAATILSGSSHGTARPCSFYCPAVGPLAFAPVGHSCRVSVVYLLGVYVPLQQEWCKLGPVRTLLLSAVEEREVPLRFAEESPAFLQPQCVVGVPAHHYTVLNHSVVAKIRISCACIRKRELEQEITEGTHTRPACDPPQHIMCYKHTH